MTLASPDVAPLVEAVQPCAREERRIERIKLVKADGKILEPRPKQGN